MLKNPANRHRAVRFTFEQWHYAFTNTLSEEQSRALYERYHVPASGSIFWGSALANFHPGHDDTYVDYHNDDRAPLLFISGSEDHIMPPKIQRSNAKHYKSDTVTEIMEFQGPHLLPAQDGWEEVADYALDWALGHATQRGRDQRVKDVRITHIGGPTVADRGRRLAAADRSDLRPARRGTSSAGARCRASWPDRRSPRRPAADRRGPAQPRPPRRQPRPRRPRAAPAAGAW